MSLNTRKRLQTILQENQHNTLLATKQGGLSSPQQRWMSTGSIPHQVSYVSQISRPPQVSAVLHSPPAPNPGNGNMQGGPCHNPPQILPCPRAKCSPAAPGTERPASSRGSPWGRWGRRRRSRKPGTGTPARSCQSRWSVRSASPRAAVTAERERGTSVRQRVPAAPPPPRDACPPLLPPPSGSGLNRMLEQSCPLQITNHFGVLPLANPAAATKYTLH